MNLLRSLITTLWSTLPHGAPPVDETLSPNSQNIVGLENDEVQDGVVIIGGGIMGLSTAYSLALALNEAASSKPENRRNVPKITIIESSDRLCPAASSHATGGLGDFGYTAGVSGVGSLSYKMHVEMAARYNGRKAYGFSEQV